jgi:hypothetical protein
VQGLVTYVFQVFLRLNVKSRVDQNAEVAFPNLSGGFELTRSPYEVNHVFNHVVKFGAYWTNISRGGMVPFSCSEG